MAPTDPRIERLIASQASPVRRAFRQFLRDARGTRAVAEVTRLLDEGRMADAVQLVDDLVVQLGRTIADAYRAGADAETRHLARQLRGREARISLTFDPTQPRAAEQIQARTLEFIQQFTESQRDVVRAALAEGLRDGLSSRAMAREFRDSVGLTVRQRGAVANYRRLLERRSPEALQRDIRDRRFDATVRRAIREDEPLSRTQIDTMVERYRQRYYDYRADTIARTQAREAVNAGRQEATRQLVDRTGIDPSRIVRVWRAAQDARTRDTHGDMHLQERGVDEPFESPSGALLMYPGDPSAPPEETIQCRCNVTTRIAPPT